MLPLSSFRALLDNLLPLRLYLLVVDLARSFALLALSGFRGLDADGRGTAAANLLLGFFPGGTAVVNFVSEG